VTPAPAPAPTARKESSLVSGTGTAYDRYGLTGNPFRELASENVEDVELFHVNLEVDDALRSIFEEVFEKENRAIVAVVGEHGTGKTERLRLASAEAKQRNAFTVYFDVTQKTPWILRGLAEEFRKAADAAGLNKTFSSPSWLRGISALEKLKDEKYDAIAAGKAIGEALNATAPSMLLLNDLHNLIESREVHAFARVLQQVSDSMKPGTLVMFDCFPSYRAWLQVNIPPFASRINRTFILPGLTNDEAALLLAKKMLPKRLVEDLDPVYPFDRDAISSLNESAGGNPRRLLELADLAIEFGVSHRLYRVDANVVKVVQPFQVTAAKAAAASTQTPADYSEDSKGSPKASPSRSGPAPTTTKPGPVAGSTLPAKPSAPQPAAMAGGNSEPAVAATRSVLSSASGAVQTGDGSSKPSVTAPTTAAPNPVSAAGTPPNSKAQVPAPSSSGEGS
jgi:hypothetical protein